MTMTPRRAVLVLLLSASLPLFGQETILRYSQTHGGVSSRVEYRILRTAGTVEITEAGNGATEKVRWTDDTGTVSWQQAIPAEGTDFGAERAGTTVRVKGTFKGRKIEKEIRIDAAPWYQVFGPLIAELLPAGSSQREFWVMNWDDLSAHRMMVRRAGRERITVNGAATDALKIHFSPAGALAPFWGADFWYGPTEAAWLVSRLPENGGVTVATLEGTGN
jgi:hypothetical protein